jgi:hypothetical protein
MAPKATAPKATAPPEAARSPKPNPRKRRPVVTRPTAPPASDGPSTQRHDDNLYVRLEVPPTTYGDNGILAVESLRYDPHVHDPAPHDPLGDTFGPLSSAQSKPPNDGQIRCYNDFDSSMVASCSVEARGEVPTSERPVHELMGFPQGASWPAKTEQHCWWCCAPFDSLPVGAPVSYDEASDTFRVVGCFCSFSCASAYMRNDRNGRLANKLYMLEYMYSRGVEDATALRPAPPREMLKIFGGTLTHEQFRNAANDNKCYRVTQFPQLVPVGMMGEDVAFDGQGTLLQRLRRGNEPGREKKHDRGAVIGEFISKVPY